MELISVIIPAFNEENRIARAVASVIDSAAVEVIVADGSSSDATAEKARAAGAEVVVSEAGRGLQMNAGSRLARGDILLFLHADTRLPENFRTDIEQVLCDRQNIAGGFRLSIDDSAQGLRLVEWGANLRSKYQQMLYGDQAIFVRRKVFLEIGGFADIRLMEDVDLIIRLKKLGRIALTNSFVKTSARRWQRLGIIQTTLRNQFFRLAYSFGVKPETLAGWYYR